MRMATKKPTRKKPLQAAAKPEPPKPTIPNELLKAFLEERITTEDAVKVTQVVDGFLWEKGDIQRYRINVWMKEPVEGMFCDRNYIGESWFVHYDKKNKTLTDKTIEPKPKQEKVF